MPAARWIVVVAVAVGALGSAKSAPGEDTLSASTISAGKRVEITVRIDTLADSCLLRRQVWGCDDCGELNVQISGRRTTHVSALNVREAGNYVLVPLSAYWDLGNPRAIGFLGYAKGLRFTILGGDTTIGHGYAASFYLESGAIVRRRVQLTEAPADAWEDARYSPPWEGD